MAHCHRGIGGDGLSRFERSREQFLGRIDGIGQPPLKGLLCIEDLTREDQLLSAAFTYCTGQRLGAACAGDDADFYFSLRKFRTFRHIGKVNRRGQFTTAAIGRAIDGPNNRNWAVDDSAGHTLID